MMKRFCNQNAKSLVDECKLSEVGCMFIGQSYDVFKGLPIDCLEQQCHHKRVDKPCPSSVEESVPPPFQSRKESVHKLLYNMMQSTVLIFQVNYFNTIMTHIVTDVESNPKLKEIYQILLLAGYFRIRIGSLKAFDKIIGGLAWCITCSNFEVDVQYNDEMQIGQKIKVGEKICEALKNMKCPYNIQPFQLQGLDLNSIYPLIQWLIKFVYETREARQKFNTRLSDYMAENIIKREDDAPKPVIEIESKRIKKNAQIHQLNKNDPLRVYSTLLEFGDVTSASTYNKLCAIAGGKVNKDVKKDPKKGGPLPSNQKTSTQQGNEKGGEFDLSSYIFESTNQTSEGNLKVVLEVGTEEKKKFKEFERKIMISGEELEKIVVENKDRIEQALKQSEEEQQESPEAKLTKTLQAENEAFENQKKLLQQKAKALQSKQNRLNKKLNQIKAIYQEVNQRVETQKAELEQYEEAKRQLEEQLEAQKLNQKETRRLQKLVQERAKLKTKKQQLRKNAQAEIQSLTRMKQKAEQNIPEIDQEVFAKMTEQMKKKKKIRDQKMLQLAEINQEMATIQRKIQKVTSPPEIAQYHKRLAEIYEAINLQIEQRKDLNTKLQQSKGVNKIASDYLELISNFKQQYLNSKSKSDKKDLIEALKANFGALEANEKMGEAILKKADETKKWNVTEYAQMIKLEKEYFKLRKRLIEMEAAEEG